MNNTKSSLGATREDAVQAEPDVLGQVFTDKVRQAGHDRKSKVNHIVLLIQGSSRHLTKVAAWLTRKDHLCPQPIILCDSSSWQQDSGTSSYGAGTVHVTDDGMARGCGWKQRIRGYVGSRYCPWSHTPMCTSCHIHDERAFLAAVVAWIESQPTDKLWELVTHSMCHFFARLVPVDTDFEDKPDVRVGNNRWIANHVQVLFTKQTVEKHQVVEYATRNTTKFDTLLLIQDSISPQSAGCKLRLAGELNKYSNKNTASIILPQGYKMFNE